jgi:hypothetical protein
LPPLWLTAADMPLCRATSECSNRSSANEQSLISVRSSTKARY